MNWLPKRFRTRRTRRPSPPTDRLAGATALCEELEARRLLSGLGFLQGTAFLDANSNGQLDQNEAYVTGATVQLFAQGNPNPVASAVTVADGAFLFGSLAPGNYTLVETPPGGYTNTGAQALSQLQIASVVANNAIDVSVIDASGVWVNYLGVNPLFEVVDYNIFSHAADTLAVGELRISVGSASGSTDLSGPFTTFCVDLSTELSFEGGEQFQVDAGPLNTGSSGAGGRIAYLYNHYAGSATSVEAGAFALAIYELRYDTTVDFFSGNFRLNRLNGPVPPWTDQGELDAMVALATNLINSSFGKNEQAIFLDATRGGTETAVKGLQSVLAKGSYNFGNAPGPISERREIHIEKLTNGLDADAPTGPQIPVGGPVTWTYEVTNTGDVTLPNVTVSDDKGTPANPGDDFAPTFIGGDTDGDNLLDLTETWAYTASGIAAAGQYENVATATSGAGSQAPISDTDLSHYFGVLPGIHIEKLTNGLDADAPTGPQIPVGGAVTWTYQVTNTGNVPLSIASLLDDNGTPANPADDFSPTFVGGDTNGDSLLDLTETWSYTAGGIALAGQYENAATVTGNDSLGTPVSDSDLSHYFGVLPGIHIEKLTNGLDADAPTGPQIPVGGAVAWTYQVTNTGNVPLSSVVVVDDNGTPANPADDFPPTFVGGDTNGDSLLDLTETWTYTAGGVALAGQYENKATVTGRDSLETPVSDKDLSHYFGVLPGIHIEKLTNGLDADAPTGPQIPVGGAVTWTYQVTNTGNVPLSNVVVMDDNGTPANPADDFPPTFVGGDTNGDSLLDLTETWTYTASGIALAGQYENKATVTGRDSLETPVSDSDLSHYFGVQPSPGDDLAATIGFWHNKNGQALINSLNGGSGSTALANWLATNFPHLFGALAGSNNLTGKTNSAVASFDLKLFDVKGQKLDNQVLAVALAVYVTDSNLAGGNYGAKYGFDVTAGSGLANVMYNVGSNGAAFGVGNNTSMSVFQLLKAADARAVNGVLYGGNKALRDKANTVFDGINEKYDID